MRYSGAAAKLSEAKRILIHRMQSEMAQADFDTAMRRTRRLWPSHLPWPWGDEPHGLRDIMTRTVS